MEKNIFLENFSSVFNDASNWLLNSGAQNIDNNTFHGSFNAWYEKDTGLYSYVYSEITGYLVTMMCFLFEITNHNKYLVSAKIAGDWLVKTADNKTGGFRGLYPLINSSIYNFKFNQIYAFDNGVIVNGLTNLYRLTKENKYLEVAVKTSDWLVKEAQSTLGTFSPIYDIKEDLFFESDKEWSMIEGSFHAKIAIGLLNLYDITKDKIYYNSSIKVCDASLGYQLNSGRYKSFLKKGGTNSHAHCYTAEGLFVAGKYLNRQDYLDSSAKSIMWLLDLQNDQGLVPRHFFDDKPNYNERVDVLAQTVRLSIIHLKDERIDKSYLTSIEKIIELILGYQSKGNSKFEHGGFYWGKTSMGIKRLDINTWVTAFSIQALEIYKNYMSNIKYLPNPFYIV